MKRVKRILVGGAVAVLGIALPLELLLGYVSYQRSMGGSALKRWVSLLPAFSSHEGKSPAPIAGDRNPFFKRRVPGYHLHPFIDYSGVLSLYPAYTPIDYFGFRNVESPYFAPRANKVVVITGGSEVAGYAHTVTIAEHLERLLNEREPGTYKVINLGMNSYTIPNEINAYVHLVHHLRPDFVISHTGYNDVMYGLMVPPGFKRLGLNYLKTFEINWLRRFYDLEPGPEIVWSLDDRGSDAIVGAILTNIEKYRGIVAANGGAFIAGIQPYVPDRHLDAGPRELFQKGSQLLDRLTKEAAGRGLETFEKVRGLGFYDHVHTNDKTSAKIAGLYVARILRLEKIRVSRTASRH